MGVLNTKATIRKIQTCKKVLVQWCRSPLSIKNQETEKDIGGPTQIWCWQVKDVFKGKWANKNYDLNVIDMPSVESVKYSKVIHVEKGGNKFVDYNKSKKNYDWYCNSLSFSKSKEKD